jgi:hypothetical protein
MDKNGKNNFADVLGMNVRYAVLIKDQRIQILVKPTAKQLRKRGIKGWHLFRTIDSQTKAAHLLEESFQNALAEIESHGRFANGKRRKASLPKSTV